MLRVTEQNQRIDDAERELLKFTMERRRGELRVRGGGPAGISGSIKEVIAKRRIGRLMQSQELSQLWKNCVEEDVAGQTRVVSLRNQQLLVEVADSVLMSELASFHRRMILKNLAATRPDMKIKNIKFRLNAKLKAGRD